MGTLQLMKSGVTLAMIVRNEARCLARCLESAKPAVEAIVAVDTGSTDDTIAIARRFGAEVDQMEWPGAFDAARNRSLELVQTEWTLWLDADEWLVPGASSAIRRAIENDRAFGFELIRRDVLPDGRTGEQSLLRLWRTSRALRFQGVIHEHFADESLNSAFPGMSIFRTDIAFFHDGFRQEVSQEKLRRNVALLRKELELRPGQIYYQIELANTLKRLGDPESGSILGEVERSVLAASDADEPPDRLVELFFATRLADLKDAEVRLPSVDALLRLARGWFPESPTTLALVAQTQIRRGELSSALATLLDLERLAESGKYDRTTTVLPKVMREGLFTNLALVAHQLGKYDVARRNYERLLRVDPANPVARNNLPLLPASR